MWVKRPPTDRDLIQVHAKDLVNPDLIDDLVTDGFSFDKKYETSANELSTALETTEKTTDVQALLRGWHGDERGPRVACCERVGAHMQYAIGQKRGDDDGHSTERRD